jgi:hypothetical protein
LVTVAWPSRAHADLQSCLDAAEGGQKLRDGGAYRRARSQFISCAAEECPGEVRKSCVAWLAELDKLTPTVVFGAHAHGKEVTDVRVSVDGEVIASRIDGKPVSLDPGEHRFRFERAGETPVDASSVVLAGEKERLVEVRFGPEPAAVALPAPPPAATPGSPSQATYVLGALGLASLVTGAVLDISGYVFLQQCNGEGPACSGQHEHAEVDWRFVTGDLLLGAGALTCLAAWLLRTPAPPAAGYRSGALFGVAPSSKGATIGLTVGF